MKKYVVILAIGVMLLAGCSPDNVEDRLDAAGDVVESGINQIVDNTSSTTAQTKKISEEEAVNIALKHAGTTQDKVTGLRTEYEVDDGVGHYDIRFLLNGKEYDYEIGATDGKIISYEQDD